MTSAAASELPQNNSPGQLEVEVGNALVKNVSAVMSVSGGLAAVAVDSLRPFLQQAPSNAGGTTALRSSSACPSSSTGRYHQHPFTGSGMLAESANNQLQKESGMAYPTATKSSMATNRTSISLSALSVSGGIQQQSAASMAAAAASPSSSSSTSSSATFVGGQPSKVRRSSGSDSAVGGAGVGATSFSAVVLSTSLSHPAALSPAKAPSIHLHTKDTFTVLGAVTPSPVAATMKVYEPALIVVPAASASATVVGNLQFAAAAAGGGGDEDASFSISPFSCLGGPSTTCTDRGLASSSSKKVKSFPLVSAAIAAEAAESSSVQMRVNNKAAANVNPSTAQQVAPLRVAALTEAAAATATATAQRLMQDKDHELKATAATNNSNTKNSMEGDNRSSKATPTAVTAAAAGKPDSSERGNRKSSVEVTKSPAAYVYYDSESPSSIPTTATTPNTNNNNNMSSSTNRRRRRASLPSPSLSSSSANYVPSTRAAADILPQPEKEGTTATNTLTAAASINSSSESIFSVPPHSRQPTITFSQKYDLIDTIGKGAFSTVWRVRERVIEQFTNKSGEKEAEEKGTDKEGPHVSLKARSGSSTCICREEDDGNPKTEGVPMSRKVFAAKFISMESATAGQASKPQTPLASSSSSIVPRTPPRRKKSSATTTSGGNHSTQSPSSADNKTDERQQAKREGNSAVQAERKADGVCSTLSDELTLFFSSASSSSSSVMSLPKSLPVEEAQILALLPPHQSVLSFVEVFCSKQECVIVTELIEGGDVFDYLAAHSGGGLAVLGSERIGAAGSSTVIFTEGTDRKKTAPSQSPRAMKVPAASNSLATSTSAAIVSSSSSLGGTRVECVFTEHHAKVIMRDLFSALALLHEHGVCHRDVKLENMMFRRKPHDYTYSPREEVTSIPSHDGAHLSSFHIKLIDFGFSKKIGSSRPLVSLCGSPNYMAPEMLRAARAASAGAGKGIGGGGLLPLPSRLAGTSTSTAGSSCTYGKEVDLWSAGVVLYVLLFGSYPFHDERKSQRHKKIMLGHYTVPSTTRLDPDSTATAAVSRMSESQEHISFLSSPDKQEVRKTTSSNLATRHQNKNNSLVPTSPAVVDLLARLLDVDPLRRIKASDALSHPWLANLNDKSKVHLRQEASEQDTQQEPLKKSLSSIGRSAQSAKPSSSSLGSGFALESPESGTVNGAARRVRATSSALSPSRIGSGGISLLNNGGRSPYFNTGRSFAHAPTTQQMHVEGERRGVLPSAEGNSSESGTTLGGGGEINTVLVDKTCSTGCSSAEAQEINRLNAERGGGVEQKGTTPPKKRRSSITTSEATMSRENTPSMPLATHGRRKVKDASCTTAHNGGVLLVATSAPTCVAHTVCSVDDSKAQATTTTTMCSSSTNVTTVVDIVSFASGSKSSPHRSTPTAARAHLSILPLGGVGMDTTVVPPHTSSEPATQITKTRERKEDFGTNDSKGGFVATTNGSTAITVSGSRRQSGLGVGLGGGDVSSGKERGIGVVSQQGAMTAPRPVVKRLAFGIDSPIIVSAGGRRGVAGEQTGDSDLSSTPPPRLQMFTTTTASPKEGNSNGISSTFNSEFTETRLHTASSAMRYGSALLVSGNGNGPKMKESLIGVCSSSSGQSTEEHTLLLYPATAAGVGGGGGGVMGRAKQNAVSALGRTVSSGIRAVAYSNPLPPSPNPNVANTNANANKSMTNTNSGGAAVITSARSTCGVTSPAKTTLTEASDVVLASATTGRRQHATGAKSREDWIEHPIDRQLFGPLEVQPPSESDKYQSPQQHQQQPKQEKEFSIFGSSARTPIAKTSAFAPGKVSAAAACSLTSTTGNKSGRRVDESKEAPLSSEGLERSPAGPFAGSASRVASARRGRRAADSTVTSEDK